MQFLIVGSGLLFWATLWL